MTDAEFAELVAEKIQLHVAQLTGLYVTTHARRADDGWTVECRMPGAACTVTVKPGARRLEGWDD